MTMHVRTRAFYSLILGAAALLSLASCGREVRVVDTAGRPIVGATVYAEAPSFGGTPSAQTDALGRAKVPRVFGEQNLVVSAPGFQMQWLPLPSFPATVTLYAEQTTALPAGFGVIPAAAK